MEVFEQVKDELSGYNILWVAEHADVAPCTLYNWLSGKTQKPRLDTVIRTAKVIGFDVRLIRAASKLRKVA